MTQLVAPARHPAFAPSWAEVFGEDRYGIVAEMTAQGQRFVWRWIPPGRFRMGSEDEAGRADREGPVHEVILCRGFWLMEAAVTQAQWQAFFGQNPSNFLGEQHPVESVSWDDSVAFIQRLGQETPGLSPRLPTEAEWEYACRAGTPGAFNDGSTCTEPKGYDPALDALGWFAENSDGTTHPVKQKRPNKWGLYDMHGNVFEWCYDGLRDYAPGVERNPFGRWEVHARRVVRGGSWYDSARLCRSAYRAQAPPESRWPHQGLRLAAGQPPEAGSGPEAAEPPGAERPPFEVE